MSFTIKIKGIEVVCSTIDELEKLLAHPMSAPTITVTSGRSLSQIAADIVHKIIKDNLLGGVEPWSPNVLEFVGAWVGLTQKEKAEVITTWIDLVEAVLKANR